MSRPVCACLCLPAVAAESWRRLSYATRYRCPAQRTLACVPACRLARSAPLARSPSQRQTAPSPCLAPPLAAAPGPRAPANRWPALGTGTPPVGRALADARPAAGGRAPGRPPPCPGRGRTHGCCCCWCENDVGLAAMRESAPLCESIDSGAGRVGLCFPGGATAPQHWIGFTISLLPLPPAQIPPQFTNSRGVRKTANPTWAQVQALPCRAPPSGAAAGGHAVGCSRGLYPSATPRGWHIAGDAEPHAARAGTATVGLVASAHRAGRRAKELRREEQRAVLPPTLPGGPVEDPLLQVVASLSAQRC